MSFFAAKPITERFKVVQAEYDAKMKDRSQLMFKLRRGSYIFRAGAILEIQSAP